MSASHPTIWLPGLLYAVVAIAAAFAWSIGTASDVGAANEPSHAPCEAFGPSLTAPVGRLEGTSAAIFTHGTVSLRTCRAGTVTVRLRGVSVDGVGSHAVVSVGTQNAFDGEIVEPTDVDVAVEAGSWIAVAFVNDGATGGEDRNLWIDEISFAARR